MKQLGVGFVLSSILFAGGTANLSGKWEVVVEGYGAPRTQKFELKQSGEGLSGVYAGTGFMLIRRSAVPGGFIGVPSPLGDAGGRCFEFSICVETRAHGGADLLPSFKVRRVPDGTGPFSCGSAPVVLP